MGGMLYKVHWHLRMLSRGCRAREGIADVKAQARTVNRSAWAPRSGRVAGGVKASRSGRRAARGRGCRRPGRSASAGVRKRGGAAVQRRVATRPSWVTVPRLALGVARAS